MYLQKKSLILKNLIETYTDFAKKGEFIIFGSPATAKNNKSITGRGALVYGKAARQYSSLFAKQIERVKYLINDIPLDKKEYFWLFDVWYSSPLSDASLDLVFDLLQYFGVITDDVTLRNFAVNSENLDKEIPRILITIYEIKNAK